MNAIYRGKLYPIIDDRGDGVLLLDGDPERVLFIAFSDPDLVVDPTDDQVAAARANERPYGPGPTF